MSKLSIHERKDAIKWVLVGFAIIAIIAAIVLGVFSSWYTNWDTSTWFGKSDTVTYRFEAEDAELSGGCYATEVEGVGCVGEFINEDTGDRIITFNVESSADTTADLLVCLSADSIDRNLSDLVIIDVNGVRVNIPYRVVRYADPRTWADWREIEVCELQLNEGANEIKFTATSTGANFDYIELTTDKDVTITMESSESEDPDTASEESEITEEAEV